MVKQKNISPGVQQIIDILKPHRTEAVVNYLSLQRVINILENIKKRSRSKQIRMDVDIIKDTVTPMIITAEEHEKRRIEAMRHWMGPNYMRDNTKWLAQE